jgi:hypothetical protein
MEGTQDRHLGNIRNESCIKWLAFSKKNLPDWSQKMQHVHAKNVVDQ